ncbi:pyruvate, phosphate dikinase [Candidatus Poriferisocius sp.]|uniref:pyruvate, phosphate dikinase n=1 Tax=Candidatus Poriferisocius sp. TaxID=3101276 RepID=UPI003B013DE6
MTERWVYSFDEMRDAKRDAGNDWEAVRALLGGKGANLADMSALGIPVPPGFTITTKACIEYQALGEHIPEGLWEQVEDALTRVAAVTGRTFAEPSNPLLVAVRSGAQFSMPGMMDTVLNVGMNDHIVDGMIENTGDARFVLDSFRRLLQMFGTVVLGVPSEEFEKVLSSARNEAGTDNELDEAVLRSLTTSFKSLIDASASQPFPTDPTSQLHDAVEAVFRSWHSRRAYDYRQASGIDHNLGTAVNIVAMVFGNAGPASGTGVVMSRDGTTGESAIEGDYLMNAQGEDVVAGSRPTKPIADLVSEVPECALELFATARLLENHYRDMQDIEFTIENGRLWILQTRSGKRTAQAAVKIAVDLANEGLITRDEALLRVSPDQIDTLMHPQFTAQDLASKPVFARGLNVSPGAAVGIAVFNPDLTQQWSSQGHHTILVRPETRPEDVHGMLSADGILTATGGRTSHAALVARQFGKPAITGADIEIDLLARTVTSEGTTIHEGEWLSLDGATGTVYQGKLATTAAEVGNDALSTLLAWADQRRVLKVRANADDSLEADRARKFGAEGVGLCRTEHMFFDSDRLPIVQRMILATSEAEQRAAIEELLPIQRQDFIGLLQAMDGLPVVIRLLDPPLHEFLPSRSELNRQISELERQLPEADLNQKTTDLTDLTNTRTLLARVETLSESNPMLGLRGVRLGLKLPHLTHMQVQAVVEAAAEVARDGGNPRPEIMVPLVGHHNELAQQRAMIHATITETETRLGTNVPVRIGTMIEVPRAALTCEQIVEHADFLSFGTNDLTQTTFAISRDDAESAFLADYLDTGILDKNPFSTIDASGVGRLMRIAMRDAQKTAPNIEVGICGEHGGDPESIKFCHQTGFSYVSCSSYRVPTARLAAAHAALEGNPTPRNTTSLSAIGTS